VGEENKNWNGSLCVYVCICRNGERRITSSEGQREIRFMSFCIGTP
jgi:hypothetical protein